MVQNPNPKATKGKNKGGATASGTIRIRRRELLRAIKVKTDPTFVELGPDNFPWLKNLAKSFDRLKWHSCQFHWRPAVATTVGGMLMMGMDWDSNSGTTLTMEAISAMTPVYEAPLWQMGQLNLPAGRLMTRKEYLIRKDPKETSDDGFSRYPGYLCYVATGTDANTDAGHLWVEYDVTMFGTVAA